MSSLVIRVSCISRLQESPDHLTQDNQPATYWRRRGSNPGSAGAHGHHSLGPGSVGQSGRLGKPGMLGKPVPQNPGSCGPCSGGLWMIKLPPRTASSSLRSRSSDRDRSLTNRDVMAVLLEQVDRDEQHRSTLQLHASCQRRDEPRDCMTTARQYRPLRATGMCCSATRPAAAIRVMARNQQSAVSLCWRFQHLPQRMPASRLRCTASRWQVSAASLVASANGKA